MIAEKILENIINQKTFQILELMLSPECNLKCRYCYMVRHNTLSNSPRMPKELIDYAINLVKRLARKCFKVDLFGGEPLLQLDLVEYVAEKVADDPQIYGITIPTNGYVASTYPQEIRRLLKRFPKITLSFSVDGPYVDEYQRPQRPEYTAKYSLDYDTLFSIYHDTNQCGFHPMIFAETAHLLFPTFTFFVTHMHTPWTNKPVGDTLYFLQVRNGGTWTQERIDALVENALKCWEYVKAHSLPRGTYVFNFLKGHSIVRRGLTCSLQTQLYVTWTGDVYPCHRLIYPEFHIGNITDLSKWNFNKLLFFQYYHRHNNLVCRSCKEFKKLNLSYCMGGCLGAQYEYWGDPLIPIPDVCSMLKQYEWRVSHVIDHDTRP